MIRMPLEVGAVPANMKSASCVPMREAREMWLGDGVAVQVGGAPMCELARLGGFPQPLRLSQPLGLLLAHALQ